jgi:hypothetical protein
VDGTGRRGRRALAVALSVLVLLLDGCTAGAALLRGGSQTGIPAAPTSAPVHWVTRDFLGLSFELPAGEADYEWLSLYEPIGPKYYWSGDPWFVRGLVWGPEKMHIWALSPPQRAEITMGAAFEVPGATRATASITKEHALGSHIATRTAVRADVYTSSSHFEIVLDLPPGPQGEWKARRFLESLRITWS